ncbi:hypothetical protein V8017_12190 [Stenotrophomonas rhizophila]
MIAAELGHPPGLAQLGALHEYGTGVEQDDVKAYAYALAAHDEGLPIDDRQFANQVAMFRGPHDRGPAGRSATAVPQHPPTAA